ncbi:hypothetical protein R3W88_012393 [Solanum pinnatisectum]|uniref:Uncharacterized protein n=1 Tax=Solanum pinnatisectum TaxID=50273 RepID=A0AAV9LBH5_9SOLN|nr:hypothetical protein R3W88_012393 [Solanum pinnatisectum]
MNRVMKKRSSVAKRQAMAANSSGLENNQIGKLNAGATKKRSIVNIDTNTCEDLRYKTDLNEKLSAAQLEITNKESLAKQHAKIRNLKEEHEQKLHDVLQNKAKQFDKMKQEFEEKIANLDQQLLRTAAENSAISSSLQESFSMVIKLSEKKSQAEAEILNHVKGK